MHRRSDSDDDRISHPADYGRHLPWWRAASGARSSEGNRGSRNIGKIKKGTSLASADGKVRTNSGRGRASAHGKSQYRPIIGFFVDVGTLQLDQISDELLSLNDWNP